jgi:uncharacterized spore protein YtfJ
MEVTEEGDRMTDEKPEAAPKAAAGDNGQAEEPLTEPTVQATLRGMLDRASVEAVFGTPVQQEGTIVVPAAEMLTVIGFGFGVGDEKEASADKNKVSGAGAGGYIFGRPVAAIAITPHTVHLLPIVDFTKIALAALTAFGLIGTLFFRLQSASQRADVEATQRALRTL